MYEQKGSLKTISPLVKEKPQFTGISKTHGVLFGGYGVHKKYAIMIVRDIQSRRSRFLEAGSPSTETLSKQITQQSD